MFKWTLLFSFYLKREENTDDSFIETMAKLQNKATNRKVFIKKINRGKNNEKNDGLYCRVGSDFRFCVL